MSVEQSSNVSKTDFISLFPLSRYSRDTDSGDVNSRNHHMLKCGALILFSVLLGAMAAMRTEPLKGHSPFLSGFF